MPAPPSESRLAAGSRLGRAFLLVWIGQTISEVGTMLSGVGAAIWVFVETGDAVWLGVLSALGALPYVFAAPFAGLIDRVPRRRMMIAADLLAAVGPLLALGVAAIGRLEVWHLCVAGFVGGVGNSLQMPASQAALPALVGDGPVDRANALRQLGPAIGIVVGPALAAPIVATWGVEAVLVVDLSSFAVGVATVGAVRFDDRPDADPADDDRSWTAAWSWMSRHGRPLLALMAVSAVVNLFLAFFNVAIISLATDVAGPARAGIVLGAGGAAMVAGSVVAAMRGSAADRVRTVACALGVLAAGLAISALRPSFVVLIVGTTVALAAVPAANAASATIYNERVPASMQGRMFALRGALGQALLPIGSAMAGVMIARVAAPAMSEGRWLGDSLGVVIGTGAERGAAVVVLVCALAIGAVAVALWRSDVGTSLRAPAAQSASTAGDRRPSVAHARRHVGARRTTAD